MAIEGLITKRSRHSAGETLTATEHGYTLFARLDHAAAAATLALTMPASTVSIFDNPRTSRDFLLPYPSLAIDLPLRAPVWADASQRVWVSTNSMQYLLETAFLRHGVPLTTELKEQVQQTTMRVAAIVDAATDLGDAN